MFHLFAITHLEPANLTQNDRNLAEARK